MKKEILNLRDSAKYIWVSEVTMKRYFERWTIPFKDIWWPNAKYKKRMAKVSNLDKFLKWE